MDLLDLSFDEMEATFRRRPKKRVPKLWSYGKKLKDPYKPQFYTKIELFVPQPNFYSPFPCILVSIRNSKYKTFFRILSLDDLESIFAIPDDEHQKAKEALEIARTEADRMEEVVRDHFSRRRLPSAMRQAVDEETGEIKTNLIN